MGVFHVFHIVQVVPNRASYHKYIYPQNFRIVEKNCKIVENSWDFQKKVAVCEKLVVICSKCYNF